MKLPPPFLCYVIPMLGTTLGILPSSHPFYTFASIQILPVCLVLLLVGTDMKEIARLGPFSIFLMFLGALGTMLGAVVSFLLYKPWLPQGSWAGVGALTASWIGGSANLVAVKEALSAPDRLIAPVIIVDAVMAYSWMALLLWASGLQDCWDEWVTGRTRAAGGADLLAARTGQGLHSPLNVLSGVSARESAGHAGGKTVSANPCRPWDGQFLFVFALAIAVSILAQGVASKLPAIGNIVSHSTWTILIVTTISLALSLTPLRNLEGAGASKLGTLLLYLILITIGARSNLRAILDAPVFLALGATWILCHGIFLFSAGYMLRAPLGLLAAVSQANIGGTISAPIVGAAYHPKLASVGLLLAILGNILGTYLGLATAFLLRS